MLGTWGRAVLLLWAALTIQLICDQAVAHEDSDMDSSPDETASTITEDVIKAEVVKGDINSLQLGKPVDSEYKRATGVKSSSSRLIFVTTLSNILRMSLPASQYDWHYIPFYWYPAVGSGAHKPKAVNYDRKDRFIYWTSVNEPDSVVGRFPYAGGSIRALDGGEASEPEGIAVDVISRNLYWTDAGTNRIVVSRLDGGFRKNLITTGLDKPRAIAVDPIAGWMYWIEWGTPPTIKRARMDGSQVSVIVTIGQGQWPTGLALDFSAQSYISNFRPTTANRLYWCNRGTGEIWTSEVTGSNARRVYTHRDASLSGIAVDRSYLFWTATNDPGVHLIRKSLQGYNKIKASGLSNLQGITVSATSNTPSQPNACSASNGNCAQLCLPVPGGGRTCACQDEWSLTSDGLSCHDPRTSCQDSCPGSDVTGASCVDGYCECSGENYQRYTCLPVVGSCEIRWYSPTAQASAFLDSKPTQTFSCVADDNNQYEVHALAVYEGVGSGFQQNKAEAPEMNVNVYVTPDPISKPLVLVLSSYEAVNWVLNLAEDVEVQKVLLIAYEIDQSNVTVQSGSVSEVQRVSGGTGGAPACAYGKDDGDCRTVEMLKYIGREFGPVSSFTGTYNAREWNLVKCPKLTAPQNGAMDPTGATDYLDLVSFSCNTGYALNGTSETRCQANGTWSNAVPTCTLIQCPTLTAPTNGVLSPTGPHTYQNRVTFTCNYGYRLYGTSSVTCRADGTWSNAVPRCTPGNSAARGRLCTDVLLWALLTAMLVSRWE
ncbi:uncharacterized protein LOC144909589 [Branchiostoma floridae x Branchiostoma belcheri]